MSVLKKIGVRALKPRHFHREVGHDIDYIIPETTRQPQEPTESIRKVTRRQVAKKYQVGNQRTSR